MQPQLRLHFRAINAASAAPSGSETPATPARDGAGSVSRRGRLGRATKV